MVRILVAECKQEVSSFNPAPSHYDDFQINTGASVLETCRGREIEIAGALSVFDTRPEVELVPTYSARSITSGGVLAAEDWQRLAREFLDAVRRAGPVDAVYYSLHGAMGAEGELDPEGYLLQETRAILGEEIPIVISLDLHGILTDRMVQHVNGLTVYHTYPHVDLYDTGARAARLLLDIIDGKAEPVIARVAIPALVRGNQLITETGLFGRSIRAAKAIEASDDGLAAGMFIGNPFTDVPELRSNSVVIVNGDAARAEEEAVRLARDFWEVREHLHQELTPLNEAINMATSNTEGTVIMVDAADATSSGASGDSNAILRALIDVGYTGRAIMPLVDAPAVSAAQQAGIGATIRVPLGGAVDPGRFQPIELECTVRLLTDGKFVNESFHTVSDAGASAVLEAQNFTIIATRKPVSLMDRSIFLAHGRDPRDFDLVVVKCPHCQPSFFEQWSALYINVDAPGATSANLHSLGHTICARPIFPLDGDIPFEPRADIFRR